MTSILIEQHNIKSSQLSTIFLKEAFTPYWDDVHCDKIPYFDIFSPEITDINKFTQCVITNIRHFLYMATYGFVYKFSRFM